MKVIFPAWVIVKRELVTALRRRRSLFYVLLSVVPCMGLVYVLWPPQGLNLVLEQRVLSELAQWFLGLYSITVLGVCGLLTPAFAVAAVSHERDTDTLDLVRTTLVSRMGIIVAKLLSSTGLFLLIALASVPVAATLFMATGLDWVQLFSIGVTIFISTLSWGLIGLACASRVRNFVFALALTYAVVFLLSGFPEVLVTSILRNWRRGWFDFTITFAHKEHVFWIFPPVAIVGLVLGEFSWDKYAAFLIGQGWIMVLAPYWAIRSIGREREARKQRVDKPIDDAAVLAARRKRFPYYLIDPLRRGEPIGDHANPMRVRELRWGLLGMHSRMIRAMYGTMAVFMMLGVIAYGSEGIYRWFVLAMTFCVLVAPPFLMPTFSRDVRQETLDALRSTLLRPRQVIYGKFAAGLATMLPLLFGIFAASLILLGANLFYDVAIANFFTGYATLAVSVTVAVSLCLLASQYTKRTATAFTAAYIGLLLLFGGLWFGGLHATKWAVIAFIRYDNLQSIESGLGVPLGNPRSGPPDDYLEKLEYGSQVWQFASPMGAYGGSSQNTYYLAPPPLRNLNPPPGLSWSRSYQLLNGRYVWQLPHPLFMWCMSMASFALLAWLFILASIRRFSKVGVRDE